MLDAMEIALATHHPVAAGSCPGAPTRPCSGAVQVGIPPWASHGGRDAAATDGLVCHVGLALSPALQAAAPLRARPTGRLPCDVGRVAPPEQLALRSVISLSEFE